MASRAATAGRVPARRASSRRGAPRARRAPVRVRWDRVGRVALLVVLACIAIIYIHPLVTLFGTWRSERAARAQVGQLARQHASLLRQRNALTNPTQLELRARAMGMVRPGELPIVIEGGARGQG